MSVKYSDYETAFLFVKYDVAGGSRVGTMRNFSLRVRLPMTYWILQLSNLMITDIKFTPNNNKFPWYPRMDFPYAYANANVILSVFMAVRGIGSEADYYHCRLFLVH
jgi:hypothetical protein